MIARFFAVHGYNFFLAVGAVAMLVLMILRRSRYSLSVAQASIYTLLLLVTGIAGAKLLYFFESGLESFSGMSFFGAVYLVLLAMPLVGLIFRMKPMDSLDACAPCVAAIVGFQRFGCYTQLMEGFGDMAVLCLLLTAEMREANRGKGYPLFLISYGAMRFAIEFVRDTSKDWLGLSHGQWFSLAGIGIALLMIIGDFVWRKLRKVNIPAGQD